MVIDGSAAWTIWTLVPSPTYFPTVSDIVWQRWLRDVYSKPMFHSTSISVFVVGTRYYNTTRNTRCRSNGPRGKCGPKATSSKQLSTEISDALRPEPPDLNLLFCKGPMFCPSHWNSIWSPCEVERRCVEMAFTNSSLLANDARRTKLHFVGAPNVDGTPKARSARLLSSEARRGRRRRAALLSSVLPRSQGRGDSASQKASLCRRSEA